MVRFLAALALTLSPLAGAGFPTGLLKKPDAWYGTEEGRQTTARILSWQSEQGDWMKNIDTTQTLNSGPRSKIKGTFDNKATTNELRYLARAYQATQDKACKDAFLQGLDLILKAQYPNGGWPQSYPVGKKGYPRFITFNDGSMVRLLQLLGEVAAGDSYSFVDADRRSAARAAVDRGVGCILKSQITIKGKPTVWCAQHDDVTLAPALARAYELPSLSGAESASVLRYLMSLEKPTPEVIRCVKDGVAWFESAKITGIRIDKSSGDCKVIADAKAPPLWARFYDLETGRPFFCDRDGVKKAELSEIGEERRNGYSWYGNWGEGVASDYAKWTHR